MNNPSFLKFRYDNLTNEDFLENNSNQNFLYSNDEHGNINDPYNFKEVILCNRLAKNLLKSIEEGFDCHKSYNNIHETTSQIMHHIYMK